MWAPEVTARDALLLRIIREEGTLHRAGRPAANEWRSQVTGRDMVPVAVARMEEPPGTEMRSYPLEMLPDGDANPPRWLGKRRKPREIQMPIL